MYTPRNLAMAGSSLFILIDDIATVLDDVATMTKVAAKRTAGVLGDDLALNAQQVAGVNADRELPVVWAVAKGSLRNKLILIPIALLISAFAPWAVVPLLMLGGAFLCYEGVETLTHRLVQGKAQTQAEHKERVQALTNPAVDMVAFEEEKIRGAVRTDFILSAEIIAITLGAVAALPFMTQLLVLIVIGLSMTLGVYGLVAALVKLDDAGLYLSRKGISGRGLGRWALRLLGRLILALAPHLMHSLAAMGTVAMFMVGGGILTHGIEAAHHFIENLAEGTAALPGIGGLLEAVTPSLLNAFVGVVVGVVLLVLVLLTTRLYRLIKA